MNLHICETPIDFLIQSILASVLAAAAKRRRAPSAGADFETFDALGAGAWPHGPKCVHALSACSIGSRTTVRRSALCARRSRAWDVFRSPARRGDSVCSWAQPIFFADAFEAKSSNCSSIHFSRPPLRQACAFVRGTSGEKKDMPNVSPIRRTMPPTVVPATFLPLTNKRSHGNVGAPTIQGSAPYASPAQNRRSSLATPRDARAMARSRAAAGAAQLPPI
mmetsp:Transcript_11177/g.37257  ORF Transcript_11177/g.37257 Transcript_11177/m.37257 type:complete len:221 (+) Transcript_11177:645-1307(+)